MTETNTPATVSIPTRLKGLWDRNKGKVAVAASITTVVVVVVARRAANQFNQFLDEKDLMEEYYNPEETSPENV